ncbi:MAG: hypothetical protein IGBAC_0456 [Ignavibacteriae bacterium]|nr:MAG: hypothetical protein IGBAC_0456 [Ignavibacteriota bacterium]
MKMIKIYTHISKSQISKKISHLHLIFKEDLFNIDKKE